MCPCIGVAQHPPLVSDVGSGTTTVEQSDEELEGGEGGRKDLHSSSSLVEEESLLT